MNNTGAVKACEKGMNTKLYFEQVSYSNQFSVIVYHLYIHLFKFRHIVTKIIKSAVHSDINYLPHSTDELH